ncbi:MAG TPA: hypothetical protein VF498_01195 [Anaerolineales bacterium]
MPFTLVLHVLNSDPVVGEVEEIPSPSDRLIVLKNPRRMDGKDLHNLSENVVTVLWPVDKVNFIEVLAGEEDERIIGFVRE